MQVVMQQQFIQHTDSAASHGNDSGYGNGTGSGYRRLILFFAGWGVDHTLFAELSKPGYDILVVYDYRSDDFDMRAIEGYDELCVLAWSLGVWHADRFIALHSELPFTRCIAVNGTLRPIDDNYGIPPRIYDLTALLPDQRSLLKFYRRICGGQAGMDALMPSLPQRSVDELRDELLAVRTSITTNDAPIDTSNWDEIYLSDNDLIFPFANMQQAWADAAPRIRVIKDGNHAIDFARLIGNAFVDKDLVGGRFASAASSYEREAEVQRKVAQTLLSCATNLPTRNIAALEIGSGTGVLTKMYLPQLSSSAVTLWDLTPATISPVNGNSINIRSCDAEIALRQTPDASLDMVFSSSTIQWFNSPRRAISEIVRILRPGGTAYISCYIDGTIPQLAQLPAASAMHYPQVDDVLDSLKDADYQSLSRQFDLTFNSASAALAHMRATGVNSLARTAMSIADTRRLMRLLTTDNGTTLLTFNTRFITIRKHG